MNKQVLKKTAIVTGGARGIGKAIACKLASQGIHTILLDINQELLEQTVTEIQSSGFSASSYVVDLRSVGAIQKSVEEIHTEYQTIDILVNNAGILSKSNIVDIEEEEWDMVMDTNVKSAVFMTKAVIKYMIKAQRGRIINISSLAGRNGGLKTGTAYSVSKAAIIGLTKRVARFAAGYGITVNAVAPGTTYTEMVKGFTDEELESLKASVPMGDLIQPNQIADAVAFLAADSSQSITGVVLDVNGGMYF